MISGYGFVDDPDLQGERPDDRRQKAILVMLALFLAITALTGGSARADSQLVIIVRVAAILFMLALVLVGRERVVTGNRGLLSFVAAMLAVVTIQLVPLPPLIWTALPGRELFAAGAAVAGIEQPWRPITLTPGLTSNSLVALFVPIPAILAVRSLGSQGRRRLIIALFVVILASGTLGMLQVAGGSDSILRLHRITNHEAGVGFMANRNHQAALLVTAFPMIGYFGRDRARAVQPAIILALSAGFGFFLLTTTWFTGSRMGLLLSLIAGILSLLVFFDAKRVARSSALALALTITVAAGALLAYQLKDAESLSRLVSVEAADDLRVLIMGDVLEIVETFFPIGAGFGSFPTVYASFERIEVMTFKYVNHAHNDLLEILIEGGAAALLLLVVFLTWWVGAAHRAFSGRERTGPSKQAAKVATIATGLLMLASITDYPLRTPLLAVVFVCLCGLMMAQVTQKRSSRLI